MTDKDYSHIAQDEQDLLCCGNAQIICTTTFIFLPTDNFGKSISHMDIFGNNEKYTCLIIIYSYCAVLMRLFQIDTSSY